MKNIATNRKARRDYEVIEAFECGIELKGSEVKSLRASKMNLDDSYARIDAREVVLHSAHISPYEQASYLNVDAVRPRKLLLHRLEIERLAGKVAQKGFTLIPLKAYFNDRGIVKIELALCKGKKIYDRREAVKRRDANLEIRRGLKEKRRR
ncbi:MAG: SsrA-binding protein SmpB [Candidatus Omnitrophica bacterium]|nr:SsrA-binding protein SmpB [Candidatus Omnitrophota bacterium]